MALNKFFRLPWATTGDKTPVPDTTQPGGEVSYPEGFGPDYELDPTSDPDAKRIPRDQTNQYLFDITTALREYQIQGTPDWITNAQNDGSPFPYARDARVRYTDNNTYISLVDANTDLPTVTASWMRETPFFLPALRASQPQAEARTDNDTLMTPLRVGQAIAAAFTANSGTGWFKLPGLNIIVQYGSISVAPNGGSVMSGSFSFPVPFTVAPLTLIGTPTDIVANWNALTCILKATSVNGGTYILDMTDPGQHSIYPTSISWIALGI